jgi:hypothetical protein
VKWLSWNINNIFFKWITHQFFASYLNEEGVIEKKREPWKVITSCCSQCLSFIFYLLSDNFNIHDNIRPLKTNIKLKKTYKMWCVCVLRYFHSSTRIDIQSTWPRFKKYRSVSQLLLLFIRHHHHWLFSTVQTTGRTDG